MTFADLHRGELPLLLPNAWDVPSALALLACGFTAIGTTSFGVAASIGRPDGGRSAREANLGLAAALRPLDCYTSVDIEDGYADDPGQVADYVDRLPVDGINIEDSTAEKLIALQEHAAKVQAIKQRSPDVFVNARIDTYWLGQDATLTATLDRAARFLPFPDSRSRTSQRLACAGCRRARCRTAPRSTPPRRPRSPFETRPRFRSPTRTPRCRSA
ncbi:isocitrate lyase/phosphoenolpyruvate mutase family protein [Mycobacterium sp.]|jgi:2-methylisocitrate lyase-like PEP mutase family enzyme|uniref:isocitrate lyase/PEP mutase family protein n=1 Tax=Mycobacterium sp. TaxID=1785 RepID=UPI0028B95CC4|nr:phosphonomutase-like enzyme [Mycobacterium sp.]MDT5053112.1 hypothetical protein [Mycobacterium sp.]